MIWRGVAVPALGFSGTLILGAVLGIIAMRLLRGARPRIVASVALGLAALVPLSAGAVTLLSFVNGTVADATQVNANFAALTPVVTTTLGGAWPDFRNDATVSAAGTWTDITGRSLSLTKRAASSLLKITYQDTLGTFGHLYEGCEWQILVDSAQVAFFSDTDADTPTDVWRMSNAAHIAWSVGLGAGSHTVKVQTRGNRGAWTMGTSQCLMGWNSVGGFLSVEEIP
jgi:hypothetical protein